MNIENGTYPAHPTGRVDVGEHSNGCLIAVIEFAFKDGGTISNTFWLTQKDGAVNTRSVETLKTLFGWDGSDPFWLADHATELTEVEVELVIENESFQGRDGSTKTAPKVKWVNPVGGGGVQIASNDRKALLSKYGAKLRAVSGGAPAKKAVTPNVPPAKEAVPPVKKQPDLPPVVPKKTTGTSNMNTCWKALTDAMADKPRGAVEDQWFEILKECHGDKAQDAFTPEDWGVVVEKMKTLFDNLPF
jgi:hypothetical protein